jgi:hypothetical protein
MPTEVVPELGRLLVLLHEVGTQLTESSNPLKRRWGAHLLEDWRSLELLEQKEAGGE